MSTFLMSHVAYHIVAQEQSIIQTSFQIFKNNKLEK